MQVCAIKNTETKNINIPAAALTGGAAGLALRQFMPVYKEEIDTVMFNQSEEIKKANVEKAGKLFTHEIRQTSKKNPDIESIKLFLADVEAKTKEQKSLIEQKIKAAPQHVQESVQKLKNTLAARMKAAETLTESTIKTAVKQARPVWAYLLPAAALSAMGAFVYNVVGAIRED